MTTHSVLNVFVLHPSGVAQNYIKCEKCCTKPTDWAALVQDVAAVLQVLPPDLSSCLGLGVVNLLQLLEAATGVEFFCFCYMPDPYCGCVGAPQLAPPTSWSQIVEQTSVSLSLSGFKMAPKVIFQAVYPY